jgi:type I restriction enzyme R subunit
MTPEAKARLNIDTMLEQSGWVVQDTDAMNPYAGAGVAVREFALESGHGAADYLLFVNRKAIGVVEAKPEGHPLIGVELQSGKYSSGLPDTLPYYLKPLPFLYESTGAETRFTNLLDPDPRSRNVFSFHRPETFAQWFNTTARSWNANLQQAAETRAGYATGYSLRRNLTIMPPLDASGLWSVQERAIGNLEESLALAKPRALVQMATGSGKTFMACHLVYRLIKHAGARRVLFLVDRSNLGRQTLREFQGFTAPEERRKFTELYNVQLLQSGCIDPVSKVSIATVQRVYSMLKGEELDPELEESSNFDAPGIRQPPPRVEYNPNIPIEEFDFIITDECHRSIYNLWRQVLDYFDAFLIGLTATPTLQTIGFFNKNLVMEYNHAQAVADSVNVDFDTYRIRTEVTEQGATIEPGYYVDQRDRRTRREEPEELQDELTYAPNQLDRDVVALDQIRTVVRTFRDKLFTEIFPGRTEVPKTVVFAKDDSHAEDIVDILRTEFGKGNDFCQKITYKTTGVSPEALLQSFRNSYSPRIAVTVDMIATGTDIKPVEIVFFMRNVRSRSFFEQMKGRGVRVISPTDFQAVTPDAQTKDRFVIVDAVGVTENELSQSYSLERHPTVSFEKLLDLVAMGNREPETLSSLASRLARLDRHLSSQDRQAIETTANGASLHELIDDLLHATDPDAVHAAARAATGQEEPSDAQVAELQNQLLEAAARPFAANPPLRNLLLDRHRNYTQTIDRVTIDHVIEAGFTEERASAMVQSFQQYLQEHRDELTALQVLYRRPYRQRLTYADLRALAEALQLPPRSWTTDGLWEAYRRLEQNRVRGSSQRVLADIVSLVRFALNQEGELAPFAAGVEQRFRGWLAMQETAGRDFTAEQRQWLEAIKDHIAGSVSIDFEAFQYAPFNQQGGLTRARALFGDGLPELLEELNLALVG